MNSDGAKSPEQHELRLGWQTAGAAAVFYAVCVSLATWPRVRWFRTYLPSLMDPLEHLWIMRWYKACLLEGQSLVFCPEVHYPTGVPLGCFTPMHFQALLYIPLSLLIPNDALCYNLLWMLGMVTTGLGTFLLAWHVVRSRWYAGFGGMLAMLSTPVLFHASAQLELIYLGSFPFFLWTWIRLFERPSRGRLAAAAGAYILVTLCTAYYAVYVVFPAALYFFWKGLGQGSRGAWAWFRDRGPWLLGFSVLVLPALVLLFGNHIWAMKQGYTLPRSFAEFQNLKVPLWSYACPSAKHVLGRRFPSSWYTASGLAPIIGECCSYLGVAALALLAYAAGFHVRFRDGRFWWACLVLLVVLSGGTAWTIAGYEITLPGYWLKKHFPLFQMIRCATRFNLFAATIAGLVAAAGLQHLLGRFRWRWVRGGVLAVLTLATIGDLAMVPYWKIQIPPPPGCYAFIKRTDPGAAFVEVPQFGSSGSDLNSLCAYWQSLHRGRTTAGYCTPPNEIFDNLMTYNSPFFAESLAKPEFLKDPDRIPMELGGTASFRDYAWLYLKVHDLRFVVLHTDPTLVPAWPGVERVKSALASAKVFEDATSVVYDRDRLTPPRDPVVLTTGGWRLAIGPSAKRVADRQAHLVLYNSDADRVLRLSIDARSLHRVRHVRLTCEAKELARWDVGPAAYQSLGCPPIQLPAGLHELVIESDKNSRPRSQSEAAGWNDMNPYSLSVDRLELEAPSELARR
jgi:hypothetical protein